MAAGKKTHKLNARDVFDIAVRWRQVSEPFDPVFYIDGLSQAAFEEGFGLQTPMVSGQNRVVRYYPQVRFLEVNLSPDAAVIVCAFGTLSLSL